MFSKPESIWDYLPKDLASRLVVTKSDQGIISLDLFKPNKKNLYRPIIIRIETINTCNYSCIFCGKKYARRDKELMDISTFNKIISEYSDLGGGFLSLTPQTGEIFLDPLLLERIRMLKKFNKITSVSFTTNAVLSLSLSDSELLEVLDGLKKLSVSFYGLDEMEHLQITGKNDFYKVVSAVNRLCILAPDKLEIGFRLLKNKSEIEINEWIMKNFNCSIPFGYTTQYATMGGTLDTNDILPFDAKWSEFKEKLDFCINPLFDLRIFSNGGVSFCCSGDPDNSDEFNLGNIKESSLLSLYNSKKSILLQKNESSRCKKCNYYHPFSEHKDNIGHFFENPLDFIGA